MSNPDRILQRLRRLPPEARRRDVLTLVQSLGWKVTKGAGDHVNVQRPGSPIIVTLGDETVKRYQLRQLLKEIDGGGGQ